MTGGGTGWVTTFRELLGNVNNITEFPTTKELKSGFPPDEVFKFAALGADQMHNLFMYGEDERRNAQLHKTYSGMFAWAGGICPHVVILNFWLNHKMFHDNATDLHSSLMREVAETDRILEVLPCNRRPRMYYMTPVTMVSERQPHLTTERSQMIVEWMRASFVPRGWVELDYQRLATARLFDSTCAEDGLHPAHNVRANLAQALANHLCFGAE